MPKKDPTPKVTGEANNTTPDAQAAEVDAAIFDQGETPTTPDPIRGTEVPVEKPSSTAQSTPAGTNETVTIDKKQFENLLERLNDVETFQMSKGTKPEDIFNPLAEVKTDHVVKLAYYDNKLVVGYEANIRPDGRTVFTYMKKNELGEIRTMIKVQLKDMETGEITVQDLDYVEFLEAAIMLEAKLKERRDIGKVIEHGEVEVQSWNGRQLVGTGVRIMSGAKEQKFLFTIEHKGEIFELPEEVVNIK